MSKIPGGVQVDRALKAVKRELKNCQRQVNQQISKLVDKGNYAGAEALMEAARAIDGFQGEVDGLRARWKEVRTAGGVAVSKDEKTPQWQFYQPVLSALVALGGSGKLRDILPDVKRQMDGRLKPGDLAVMANGRPRWEVMVRRSRKHLENEGFIEPHTGQTWRITPAGRRAAKAGIDREP